MGDEVVHVSVLSGRAEPAALVFVPGSVTHPLSLGTRGNWVITADGVVPVHLYLAFDGQTIHVAAAAPNAPVLLAGRPVGPTWAAAPVPCELRFGGACLILRRKEAAQDDWVPSTMSDNGALWKAAQRAVEAARAGGGPAIAYTPPAYGGSTLRITPAASTPPPGGPGPGGLSVTSASVAPPPLNAAGTTAGSDAGAPETSRSNGMARGYWQSASMVKKAIIVLMPFALVGTYFTLKEDKRAPAHAVVPTTVASSTRGTGDAGPPGAASGAPSTGAAGGAAVPAGMASAASETNPVASSTPRSTAPSVTETAAAGASAAPAASVAVPTAHPGKATGGKARRTPEREALDAVANGSYAEAAKDYDALAAAHADNPSYSDAARIMHGKSAHGH